MFKIVAALLGFYYFGFFGALAAFFFGSMIDRSISYGIGGVNPLSRAHRQSVFLGAVFVLMPRPGYLWVILSHLVSNLMH